MEKIQELLANHNQLKNIPSLKQEYKKALLDDRFKLLVNALKIPEGIGIKYTSLLEESALEYDHCLKCTNIMECQNKIRGYCYIPKISSTKLEFNYHACRFQNEILKRNTYLENISFYNTPADTPCAEMKDIYPDEYRLETIKFLRNFITNYPKVKKGLYLHGNFGCGKSYLISAAFSELAKKNIKSAIVFWPEYLRDLKSSFGDYFSIKFDYIKTVPLLFIDDIGAENLTSWGRDEILCSILQYRMDKELPTFFTSNLNLKALEEHLSITKSGVEIVKARRIIERIKQLTEEIEMIGKNYRK